MIDRTKATATEAIKAYPWVLLYRWSMKAMGRKYPWNRGRVKLSFEIRYDGMTLTNKLYLVASKRSNPWFSRYPRWATSRGGSCGCVVKGSSRRCEIVGLGHPGPHRSRGSSWAREV